jgi:hypothetical protein
MQVADRIRSVTVGWRALGLIGPHMPVDGRGQLLELQRYPLARLLGGLKPSEQCSELLL